MRFIVWRIVRPNPESVWHVCVFVHVTHANRIKWCTFTDTKAKWYYNDEKMKKRRKKQMTKRMARAPLLCGLLWQWDSYCCLVYVLIAMWHERIEQNKTKKKTQNVYVKNGIKTEEMWNKRLLFLKLDSSYASPHSVHYSVLPPVILDDSKNLFINKIGMKNRTICMHLDTLLARQANADTFKYKAEPTSLLWNSLLLTKQCHNVELYIGKVCLFCLIVIWMRIILSWMNDKQTAVLFSFANIRMFTDCIIVEIKIVQWLRRL